MRHRFFIFAIALISVQLATAQAGSLDGCDATVCKMTFHFGPMGPHTEIAGYAAFSGQASSQIVRNLPDATQTIAILRLPPPMIYRDSQGRVRMERPMLPTPLVGKSPVDATEVEILDPLAGYLYFLDSVNRVAHRLPVQPDPDSGPFAFANTPYEFLGTRIMFDIPVTGVRTTSTSPRDSRTVVSETWADPRTGVVLLRKTTGPSGESIMTLQKYSNAEPDPALFVVPGDYQLVDEAGPFTIVIPRARN